MRLLARLAPALLVPLACGCSGPADRNAGDVESLEPLAMAEDLRIGSVDDPDAGFTRVGYLDEDRDGQVFVYEMQDQQVRVYDRAGNRVRTFGRPGEGPGEFSLVGALGVTGDTVWTLDRGLRRTTLFDRTGRVLATGRAGGVSVPLQNPMWTGMITPRALRRDGRFASDMTTIMMRRDETPTGIGVNDTILLPRLLFDIDGAVVDTAGWFPYPPAPVSDPRLVEVKGTRYVVPRAIADAPIHAMMDDGGYYVTRFRPTSPEPAEFSVARITESGDTLFLRRFRYTPHRYTAALLDTMAWQSARVPGGFFNPATGPAPTPDGVDINVVRQTIRDAMEWPEFQIPVEFTYVGDDGTLWLRREDDGGASYRYMVLSGDGAVRGALAVPRSLSLRWIGADHFWAVDTDELGVPWLVRFRYGDTAGPTG